MEVIHGNAQTFHQRVQARSRSAARAIRRVRHGVEPANKILTFPGLVYGLPPTGWCWVFVNGCQTIAIRAKFATPTPVNGRSTASEMGFRSMARNSRGHFPANTRRLLARGRGRCWILTVDQKRRVPRRAASRIWKPSSYGCVAYRPQSLKS